jgi:hypothetical protein
VHQRDSADSLVLRWMFFAGRSDDKLSFTNHDQIGVFDIEGLA